MYWCDAFNQFSDVHIKILHVPLVGRMLTGWANTDRIFLFYQVLRPWLERRRKYNLTYVKTQSCVWWIHPWMRSMSHYQDFLLNKKQHICMFIGGEFKNKNAEKECIEYHPFIGFDQTKPLSFSARVVSSGCHCLDWPWFEFSGPFPSYLFSAKVLRAPKCLSQSNPSCLCVTFFLFMLSL